MTATRLTVNRQQVKHNTATTRTSNYKLNRRKQEARKIKGITSQTQPNFSPEGIVYKDFDKSAYLTSDPSTTFKFSMLLDQLYGDENRACAIHDKSDPYIYEYIAWEDNSGAYEKMQVVTNTLLDHSTPVKLATLHVFNTTDSIHVQGSAKNVKIYIHDILTILMQITRCSQVCDIQNINCIKCYTNPNPNCIQPSNQLAITASTDHAQSMSYALPQSLLNPAAQPFNSFTINTPINSSANANCYTQLTKPTGEKLPLVLLDIGSALLDSTQDHMDFTSASSFIVSESKPENSKSNPNPQK